MQLAIVTGGYGPERAGSILSGRHVHEACISLGIDARVYDAAHLDFREIATAERLFLTTHGWFGEDGKLQGMLDMLRIPYSGSGVAASAAAYFKPFANAIAQNAGLRVPKTHLLDLSTRDAFSSPQLIQECGPVIFVKPASNGCSQGAKILRCVNEIDEWMEVAGNDDFPIFLAAQYIHGKDLSVGIVEIERQPVVLPLLETKHDDQFYSYEVKSGKSPHLHICPAEVSDSVEIEIKNQALAIYQELGCRGFARVDFILSNEKPWFLEVNTIPGLSRNGNLSQMGAAFGWTYEDMIFHLISTIDDSFKYKP